MTAPSYPRLRPAPAPIHDHALRVVIEERIAELWAWRAWYRQRADWASFMGLRAEHDAELRALVRLARRARKIAAAAPDPIDSYRSALERGIGYHDHQAAAR